MDLLLGLDMLKAHQACIDLEKGVLRIQGREVKFLAEHELPDKAREPPEVAESASGPSSSGAPSSRPAPPAQPAFPGGGRTLGATPSARGGRGGAPPAPSRPAQPATRHSEEKIRTLMDLGASRELAISTLEAAGGNVDVAASLLF